MDTLLGAAVEIELAPHTRCDFDTGLELSLDCPLCRRKGRTIDFRLGQPQGLCVAGRHPFPGQLRDVQRSEARQADGSGLARADYLLACTYTAFLDTQDGQPSEPQAGWGRVRFALHCGTCGRENSASTQNNLSRPASLHCPNGHPLGTDVQAQPVLRMR